MHLLSYNGCIHVCKVVLLLVCQLVYSSHSVPLPFSLDGHHPGLSRSGHGSPIDVASLIDPIHQSGLEDLESKKTVVKSIFNTPFRTPPPSLNNCPPGQKRLIDGSCVQEISEITLNEETLGAVLATFYNKRKPSRHRPRTTTPRPKVQGIILVLCLFTFFFRHILTLYVHII